MRLNCFHDQQRLNHFRQDNNCIFGNNFCFCCSRNEKNLPKYPLYNEETIIHILDECKAWDEERQYYLEEYITIIVNYQKILKYQTL